MAKARVLILGGNRYNVPAIRAARNAGFHVMVADRNATAPGLKVSDLGLVIDLADVRMLKAAIEEHGGIDGVVSTAEVGVRPAAELASRLGLPSIGLEAAVSATSKAAMRQCWQSLRGFTTEFRIVHSGYEALQGVESMGAFPLIFKPDRSFGGSRGVSRVDNAKQVVPAFEFAKSAGLPQSGVVIERCVEGPEYSCEVLIWQGKTSVLCVGEKVKSPQPYRVDLSVRYPALLTPDQIALVEEMCQAAVEALGLTQGAAHVEFAYTSVGPVLFEVGARCGGGHTPQIAHYVSGVDEFIECCRMACGKPPRQLHATRRLGADYRFLIFPEGRVQQVRIADQLQNHCGIVDVEVTVQPGETVSDVECTSDRAGFVVAVAEGRHAAVELADWACRQIQVEYAEGTVAHPRLLPLEDSDGDE